MLVKSQAVAAKQNMLVGIVKGIAGYPVNVLLSSIKAVAKPMLPKNPPTIDPDVLLSIKTLAEGSMLSQGLSSSGSFSPLSSKLHYGSDFVSFSVQPFRRLSN